jgi:hypothetical protein
VPDFEAIRFFMTQSGLRVTAAVRRYRPLRYVLLGAKNEIKSARTKTVLKGTWALYGFESIIWAQRLD